MTFDAHEVAAVFGRAAPTYDAVIPFFAEFGRRLVTFAELRPGESVLDVGCGRGATLFPAAERVGPRGRVVGVDLSAEMVALTAAEIEQRRIANATVRQVDAEALDVEDEFDVVVCSFVLHLVPNPERVAAGLFGALAGGGRCIASVPTGGGPEWDFLGELFRSFAPRANRPMPIPFRSEFDLAAVLASGGFNLERAVDEEAGFVFADEQAWWEWSWSNGIRAVFEILSPSDLEDLRREVFAELAARKTPQGLPMQQRAKFAMARKPLT